RVDDRPAEKRDRVTGGREVRMDGGPRGPGPATGGPSVRGHHPDVADLIVVALVVAGAREGDPASVRRPDRVAVIVVALGDLARLAARGVHYEDVGATVVGKDLTVEPGLERGDDPRRPRLGFLLLGL